ncbi:hypothetical protein ABZ815_20450 [Nonomuraea sp. NPDC047529]
MNGPLFASLPAMGLFAWLMAGWGVLSATIGLLIGWHARGKGPRR